MFCACLNCCMCVCVCFFFLHSGTYIQIVLRSYHTTGSEMGAAFSFYNPDASIIEQVLMEVQEKHKDMVQ
jgi:hypothetical protein